MLHINNLSKNILRDLSDIFWGNLFRSDWVLWAFMLSSNIIRRSFKEVRSSCYEHPSAHVDEVGEEGRWPPIFF